MPDKEKERSIHRNHPLRYLQRMYEGKTLDIIDFLHQRGLLKATLIDEVLTQREALQPDDVTLTGLQMTIQGSSALVKGDRHGRTPYLVGSILDGLDGPLARHLGKSSPEGAVKDVISDRIADLTTAGLISQGLGYFVKNPDFQFSLQRSFLYSCLTKSTSVMVGVPTREGTIGSMTERRRVLLLVLQDLGTLYHKYHLDELPISGIDGPDIKRLQMIEERTGLLITNSEKNARKRIDAILRYVQRPEYDGYKNPLEDPHTEAAVEARKYVVVATLSKNQYGIDIIENLNNLNPGFKFPSAEELTSRYEYIRDSMNATRDFTEKALSIAGVS